MNSLTRIIVLIVMGMLSSMTVGIIAVVAVELASFNPGQNKQPIGLIGAECAKELDELESEISRLKTTLATWREEIDATKSSGREVMGTPVPVPDEIPSWQGKDEFERSMAEATTATVKMEFVDCVYYPCVAVFRSERADLARTLKKRFSSTNIDWSERWVSEGMDESKLGKTHYLAIRFYPKANVTIDHEHFLKSGVEFALDRAMNGTN